MDMDRFCATAPRMIFAKRPFVLVCLLSLGAWAGKVQALTSYLLIQGDFGGTGLATYKWQVIYNPGQLTTGADLIKAVFGPMTAAGTYTDGFFSTNPYSTQGNSTLGTGVINFSFGDLIESFTIGGNKLAMDPMYDPGWNYYDAGGKPDSASAAYSSGLWTYGSSGYGSRLLADGSYDGWVYGGTFDPLVSIAGSDTNLGTSLANDPIASSFTPAGGTTVINLTSTPEPGRALLCWIGCGWVLSRRRRSLNPQS